MTEPLTATTLAELLGTKVMDADDAAEYLGIDRGSLETACHRKRIRYVQYGSKKLFAVGDLDDYAKARGQGWDSRLTDVEPIVVKPSGSRGRRAA